MSLGFIFIQVRIIFDFNWLNYTYIYAIIFRVIKKDSFVERIIYHMNIGLLET